MLYSHISFLKSRLGLAIPHYSFCPTYMVNKNIIAAVEKVQKWHPSLLTKDSDGCRKSEAVNADQVGFESAPFNSLIVTTV